MGAHHALSWPLLQALFIIATSMAARAINKGAFIMRSRLLSPDDPRCRIPSCKCVGLSMRQECPLFLQSLPKW
jgi:hypothetical protein